MRYDFNKQSKGIKFFDGAFGTYYQTKTDDPNACELANLTNKKAVLGIHREYISAGATAIKTNTFWANPLVYGERELKEIIAEGYRLAMEAADGTEAEVFADIGNIESDDISDSDLAKQYLLISDIFIELGAINFIFETQSEFEAVKPAIANIKSRCKGSVVLVSFAVSQDGYSRKGLYYKTLISQAAQNSNVDITGLNCVCGPAHLFNLAEGLKDVPKPLSIMPNAGYPSIVNGRTVFQDNAEYFSQKLAKINDLGVNVLGGCCGTTPKHIELAIKTVLGKNGAKEEKPLAKQPLPSYTHAKKLPLKELFVELDPPPDGDCGFILSAVDKLHCCGVTTVTLTDSPLAKVRADSILTAAKVKSQKNIDVLPHMTCRDKNRIAIKGSLIGASFFGIDKILAVTGDPVCDSNYKKSGVFDFNSRKLISYIHSLNEDIFSECPFSVGGAMNVNARNFEAELKRCAEKAENGADFLVSQPIFTKTAAENFKKAKKQLNCKLYAGIMPVASYKNAIFLNNEVSGIEIPQNILDRLKDKAADEIYNISISFSGEIIEDIYDYADGFYIMTPLKKVDLVCELIRRCFDIKKGCAEN